MYIDNTAIINGTLVTICLIVVWFGITDGVVNAIQFILYKLKIIKSYTPILTVRKAKLVRLRSAIYRSKTNRKRNNITS
jgi:hypothetical protein